MPPKMAAQNANGGGRRGAGTQAAARPDLARSRKGAKGRAVTALVGKKAFAEMSPGVLRAYWSAKHHNVPPPLRTSFGNFTCLNSVVRFTVQTSTTANIYVWIPWTDTALAALEFGGGTAAGISQHTYGTLGSGAPLQVRPLRSSFTLENITQVVNRAGQARVYSYDNAIGVRFTLPAVSTNATLVAGGDVDLQGLIASAPLVEELTAEELAKEMEFVGVPSAYAAYNDYYQFQTMTNVVEGSALLGVDASLVISGLPSILYTAGTSTTGLGAPGALGVLPPVRGFIVMFPPTTVAQSYRFECRRQDGCRYPVNTLGATFAQTHPKLTATKEDLVMHSIGEISKSPAAGVAMSSSTNMVAGAIRLANYLAAEDPEMQMIGRLGRQALGVARAFLPAPRFQPGGFRQRAPLAIRDR